MMTSIKMHVMLEMVSLIHAYKLGYKYVYMYDASTQNKHHITVVFPQECVQHGIKIMLSTYNDISSDNNSS